MYAIDGNVRNQMRSHITNTHFFNTKFFQYPHESDNTMLLPLFVLVIFTLFIGFIGIPFAPDHRGIYFDALSKWLTPSINLLHSNSSNSAD